MADLSDALLHPGLRGRGLPSAEAKGILAAHALGGLLSLAAALLWFTARQPQSALEWLALAALASPLSVALAARVLPTLGALQIASALNMILVLTTLSAVTGGLGSLFLIWLILVPAEAAVARRAPVVAASIAAGLIAICGLMAMTVSGAIPGSLVPPPLAAWLHGASLLGGLVYGALLALQIRRNDEAHAASLSESEANYRFIAENAADIILRLSREGRIVYASPAASRFTGRAPGDLIGRALSDLVMPGDGGELQRLITRSAYFAEEHTLECRLKHRSGDARTIELKSGPMRRPRPIARARIAWPWRAHTSETSGQDVIAIARDMTARKAAEDDLRTARAEALQQSETKSRFLANMSHELRTPLNSILGFAQMIENEVFGPPGHPNYRQYAGLIGESGRFLLELINDILDLSKVEAGKYEIHAELLDPAAIIRRTLHLMAPQFRDKGVHLRFAVARETMTVETDQRVLRQIAHNLLSNALKFTPAGGEVEIALRSIGERWQIAVRDTGVGIAARDLERLSQRFARADTDFVRNSQGTGLGLSLVRVLSELQGGRLRLSSELGRGTEVIVDLPARAAAPGEPALAA